MHLGRDASDHWNTKRNATWKNLEADALAARRFAFSYLSGATQQDICLRHRKGLNSLVSVCMLLVKAVV